MRYCSSDIRHESTWQQFLSALERNPHMHLSRYLRIHNVSQRGFEKWLYKKGYSVREAKDRVLQLQRESAIRESSLTEASSFLPIASDRPSQYSRFRSTAPDNGSNRRSHSFDNSLIPSHPPPYSFVISRGIFLKVMPNRISSGALKAHRSA